MRIFILILNTLTGVLPAALFQHLIIVLQADKNLRPHTVKCKTQIG